MDPNQQQQPFTAPQPPNAPTPTPTQPYTAPPVDNGHTLGIVGLILGVFGIWFVGLPLSIVSIKKAGKVGASKTLGIVGVVLNILAIFVYVYYSFFYDGLYGCATKS
ncbi:hypothetical protein EOL96_04730 [Candidatus Saccharibacteria bacterium]|nr:hypothetical protein [Candidatus Saccharibacteria bacterium]